MGDAQASSSNTPASLGRDPACIVGMACRLPGGIKSASGLWEFLMRKGCAQGPIPAQRFNSDGFYNAGGGSSARGGLMDVAGGYFLDEDVRTFDNAFFGIHNLEAASMDPQQRKLLEIVYECFEHSGTSLDRVSGTDTGVFVGNFTLDHQTMQSRDIDAIHRFSATGCGTTILANRVSHAFNLQGPSVTLDTACSSSLYALHCAASALDAGDCDAAIVAAVNLIMSPEQCIAAAKSGVLSPTSTCHTFDAAADGYGRAEGMNAIYLKRLSSALRDKDKIWAVIRGTAVNANGKTPGITQPSAALQETVIRKAYLKAGLDFADSDYVECHGTGTPVGDLIEVDALSRCFASPARSGPLLIGSSKPGLGHSEAASGLTALIKVALALDRGTIPPTYGVENLNPKLRLAKLNLKVATEAEDWPRELRRASINAFGYGGANSHAILEGAASYLGLDYQRNACSLCDSHQSEVLVLPMSATSSRSLETRLRQVRDVLKAGDSDTLRTMAYTLGERTSHLSSRSVLYARYVPGEKPEILNLTAVTDNAEAMGITLPVAMVFTGQGAQYANMGKDLLLKNEGFRRSIRNLDSSLQALLPPEHVPGWTLESAILEPPEVSRVYQAGRSQPVCTAIQIALVDLVRSWGISAHAVVGHSSGEIAAAYAAGLLNAPQAIVVAHYRGWVVEKMTRKGAMLAAGVHADVAREIIQQAHLDTEVCVACVNSPESVTLSGSIHGIELLMTELQRQGKFARKLHTGQRAYHSVMMEQVGQLYEELIAPYLDSNSEGDPKESLAVLMYSSVQKSAEDDDLLLLRGSMSSRYWRRNLEQPVQFSLALSTLLDRFKKLHVVEVGPHPALKAPVEQVRSHLKLDHLSVPYSCTLVRDKDADLCMKQLSGDFFLYNHHLQWKNVNCMTAPGISTDLPPYPWDYSPGILWQEPRASIELRNRQNPRHELLGSRLIDGSGMSWAWRNVLNIDEVPWVRDHKLESQIVFPASGYLAMAIEALSQTRSNFSRTTDSVELRHVTINTALIVPDGESRDGVELHTALSSREISSSSISQDWHDFRISSFAAGRATLHCTGSIRIVDGLSCVTSAEAFIITNSGGFEEWPDMSIWYQKFASEGLNFGPSFQSVEKLQTDDFRAHLEAKGTVRLVPPISEGFNKPRYPIHPITIDSCIQVAIMGSGAGDVNETHVYLPVFIDHCRINPADSDDCHALGLVHAISTKTSLSTRSMSSSLWSKRCASKPFVHLQGVRVTQYKAGLLREPAVPRQPCLRVHWKPDIRHIDTRTALKLDRYISGFISWCHDENMELADNQCLAVISTLVDLAGHLNPRMRVLELGDSAEYNGKKLMRILGDDAGFRRYRSWDSGTIDNTGSIHLKAGHEGVKTSPESTFELLLVHTSQNVWSWIDHVDSLISDQGFVVTENTNAAIESLQQRRFTVTEFPDSRVVIASRQLIDRMNNESLDAILVVHNPSSAVSGFAEALATYLKDRANIKKTQIVSIYQIADVRLQKQTMCISLIELDHAFLACMEQRDMDCLRCITDTVTNILWLSGANMLGKNPVPDLGLSNGFSRALMLEQPSLNFVVLDLGPVSHYDDITCANVARVLKSCCLNDNTEIDKEFAQKDGLLYVSRFGPDFDINSLFRRRLETDGRIVKSKLSAAHPAKLTLGNNGSGDIIHFEQVREPTSETPNGFVDVLVKAFSLNPKDAYTLQGRLETRGATTALEFSGVVTTVGPDVVHLKTGDRVVVGMPCKFATSQRVPVWAAHKMLPGEHYADMSTLPTIYGTALYALVHRAHLRVGESVLIHGGAGAFGFAAITIAKKILGTAAKIYTTAGSQPRKRFIADELGVPESNIFHSRTTSFAADIKSATRGHGVDVVVNFLTGDLMRASWECVAQFGRFVEIGKRDLLDDGRLDLHVFLRNTTFTAFDLSDLYYRRVENGDDTCSRLLAEVFDLYRSGDIKAPPIVIFSAAEISEAYRHFSSEKRLGKVVISFENEDSRIPLAPSRYLTLFDSQKVYLLIGCLGGLGRSLSRWMVGRGARKFVFLGRSACDKPSARQFVSRLVEAGATVKVIRGNVSHRSDVDLAVSACLESGNCLGGVVQAAMGLHEALFSRMTSEQWQTAMQPKWKGTWNLHKALEGHDQDLDFFLLTSSLTGSVGTATESNYCAANGFLDAFARWRRTQGKPAISVGLGMISEVGYLHENPEIEALLLRKGIQPLKEAEFLQVIDLALSGTPQVSTPKDDEGFALGHILTGLEPLGFRQLISKGFDINFSSSQDPRLAILAAAFEAEQDAEKERSGKVIAKRGEFETSARWLHNVPTHALRLLESQTDADSMQGAISRLVTKRFSSLILTPVDQIDDGKALSRFGVDSMIASELRTWFWTAFKVDVPFLDIMDPEKTLSSLAEFVEMRFLDGSEFA